jgi:predicted dehydrogenase
MKKLEVGIIGCGLIGEKRGVALSQFPDCHLKSVYDVNPERSRQLAEKFGCSVVQSSNEIFGDKEIGIVIVSPINKYIVPISVRALQSGKHVLCEKPPGRNLEETKQLCEMASRSKGRLKVGFNHRHHPAISKAKELMDHGEIGPLYYLRCSYGHGGRPGCDKEWRAAKELSGGGELLDQGIHVADLFRWFLGELEEVYGNTSTYFWNMDVEDNAFALFKTSIGQTALMHTSWTQWKNKFSFEIFGESGYLIVEGLGGSYGTETLRIGRRKKVTGIKEPLAISHQQKIDIQYIGGIPDEEVIEFSGPDISWEAEWKEFLSAIRENREPMGNGKDGLEAMRMIEAVYRSSKENRPIKIKEVK